jgi:hypothetical protein
MITREEFEEMFEKEWFFCVWGTELENDLFFNRSITRLRYHYNRITGGYFVIFTVVDESNPDFGSILWNYDEWCPDYEEFVKFKKWIWHDESQKPKSKRQKKFVVGKK